MCRWWNAPALVRLALPLLTLMVTRAVIGSLAPWKQVSLPRGISRSSVYVRTHGFALRNFPPVLQRVSGNNSLGRIHEMTAEDQNTLSTVVHPESLRHRVAVVAIEDAVFADGKAVLGEVVHAPVLLGVLVPAFVWHA